jgi:membrane protease YdiL (CAAX protease family)
VASCTHCGASTPDTAAWCGQCYQPLAPQLAPPLAPLLQSAQVQSAQLTQLAPPDPASRIDAPAAPSTWLPPQLPPPVPPQWSPPAAPAYAGSDRFGLAPAGGGPMLPPPGLPAAPGTWVPTHPGGLPAYTAENARIDGRLLDKRALRLVALAIGLGGVMQVAGVIIGKDTHLEPSVLIAIDIVMTLAFYGVVAGMVVWQITPSVRLRWGDGSLAGRLLTGLLLGAGLSGVLLALVSAAVGHLQPDPRFLLLMSEGDPTHIVLVVLVTCVAAPLVEETLFRGLLLEALRPRGKGLAIVASALAFAIWHFIPAALVYYGFMGAGFAAIYLKRGLATSMAAHAGFNGVLTVAAITIVLAPAHVVSLEGLTFTAPGGWSTVASPTISSSGNLLDLRGPSAAEVSVIEIPVATDQPADQLAARLQAGSGQLSESLGGSATNVRETTTPAGPAVEVDIDVHSHHGDAVLLPVAGEVYEFIFLNAGSVKATEDFSRMLDSIQVG